MGGNECHAVSPRSFNLYICINLSRDLYTHTGYLHTPLIVLARSQISFARPLHLRFLFAVETASVELKSTTYLFVPIYIKVLMHQYIFAPSVLYSVEKTYVGARSTSPPSTCLHCWELGRGLVRSSPPFLSTAYIFSHYLELSMFKIVNF